MLLLASLLLPRTYFPASNKAKLFSTLRQEILERGEESISWLISEQESEGRSQFQQRQILNAHFIYVKPEPCSKPYLISASPSCLQQLRFPLDTLQTKEFVETFSGNVLLPGLDTPYVTNYGCHR
jgi:hypothetical protein